MRWISLPSFLLSFSLSLYCNLSVCLSVKFFLSRRYEERASARRSWVAWTAHRGLISVELGSRVGLAVWLGCMYVCMYARECMSLGSESFPMSGDELCLVGVVVPGLRSMHA